MMEPAEGEWNMVWVGERVEGSWAADYYFYALNQQGCDANLNGRENEYPLDL